LRPPATLPDVLPILPIGSATLLPLEIVPIEARTRESQALVDRVMASDRLLGVFGREASEESGLRATGTAATVHRLVREGEGPVRILVQGLERVRLGELVQREPFLVARVTPFPDLVDAGAEVDAAARAVRDLFTELTRERAPQLSGFVSQQVVDPVQLVYVIAANLELEPARRQELLEAHPVGAKLRRLLEILQHERTVGELRAKIERDTREELTRSQREHLLREQLRAIQRELGEQEPSGAGDLRARLTELELPAAAAREVERELARLERLPESSPEHAMVRTFLEWMLAVPWGVVTAAPIDLGRARAILDEDHYDLDQVKERILEHLAVKKLRDERAAARPPAAAGEAEAAGDGEGAREPILCLVGPPGVGKTSLGQSIARAMDRKFTRISLGGVHDESEIRGHRRTYVGAMPGRLVQALRRVAVADPVLMLDEIDKLGAGFHGDPAAALLEVLDPAQNKNFVDTYLGVPIDLSTVFFICTANRIDTIPPPLRDRMELISLSGYTEAEKAGIARQHLLPKLLAAHGLEPGEVIVEDAALAQVVRDYTREAGVRDLERVLARALRKVARRIGEGEQGPIRITPANLAELVGRPRFRQERAERIDRPGVALGLAWTPVGGEVLFVEATMSPARDEQLILTGMLGDVMRESAQAALSYLKANGARLGVAPGALEGKAVHVHVPAGATPKDGPSAGVAIVTAIASLATGALVRDDVAMTGEITLRGRVTPIGGVKEKVLAAHAHHLAAVILPRGNEDDLEEIPREVREQMRIELVDSVEEVLAIALTPQGGRTREWTAEAGAAASP
jgi:ATP-dependent Lon protease